MFKLWAKIINDERLQTSRLFEYDGDFNKDELFDYLSDICHKLDCPTPVVLSAHKNGLNQFNITRFLAHDFIEPVHFEKLIIEFVAPDKA